MSIFTIVEKESKPHYDCTVIKFDSDLEATKFHFMMDKTYPIMSDFSHSFAVDKLYGNTIELFHFHK